MKNKLLEKALTNKRSIGMERVPISKEECELAVMYLEGKLSARQYAAAFGKVDGGFTTHRIATVLRWGMERGLIQVKLKP